LRTGRNAPPVLQSPEHDLDPVAAFVAAFVVLDGLSARLPVGDAGLYPLVFQRISEPVGDVAPVGQQLFRRGQAAEHGSCTSIVADRACGHVELDRATLRVGDGMQFCVHAALGPADQAASPIVEPPIFDRRLVAVRCAFR
jgi:hypothetical protein